MYPTVKDEQQAYILANAYGFSPARYFKKYGDTEFSYGKYEPDNTPLAESRFMLLAHSCDKTNVLIKYTPADLIIP